MISTLLLSSALVAGQVPVARPAQESAPVAGQIALQPTAPPSGPAAKPSDPPAANGGDKKDEPEKKDEEDKKEEEKKETKYLIERLLQGTPSGQILADHGIRVYGWTDMNYTVSTANRSNAPVAFNDRANFFQMNQNWFEVSKAIDTSKDEVQFGGKASLIVPGTDYRFTLAKGFWTNQLQDGKGYGFDLVYHYGDVFLPGVGGQGTTLRVGRWATGIGYEQIDAVNTPFLTKSYVFQYDPFTHTGGQAMTQIDDDWSVYNGLVTGADVYFNRAGTLTYVGGVKWAPKEGPTSVGVNVMVNNNKFNAGDSFANYNCYNMVVTHKFTDKFTYVLDATFSHMRDIPNVGATTWYGCANYYLWQFAEKMASNFRWELFKDTDGVRTGTAGTYFEMTYGLTWTPVDSVMIRPFSRYDHNTQGAFEGKPSLYTGGVELIFRW